MGGFSLLGKRSDVSAGKHHSPLWMIGSLATRANTEDAASGVRVGVRHDIGPDKAFARQRSSRVRPLRLIRLSKAITGNVMSFGW